MAGAYRFDATSAQKIQKQTRAAELRPTSTVKQPRKATFQGGTSKIAKTTTSIGARSGDTCGNGTANLYLLKEDGSLTNMGYSIKVYNMVGTSVGSGRYIQVKIIDGLWVVDLDACT